MEFERLDGGLKKSNLDIGLSEEIALNKKMSKSVSDVKTAIKSDECIYCREKVSGFCNSHTIPRFCLENIGNKGEVAGINAILGLPEMGVSIGKKSLGINASGTFSLICKKCDSTIFQDYENPDNYLSGKIPTQKMLAQIAIKNYLKFIYKRKFEIGLANHSLDQVINRVPNFNNVKDIQKFATKIHVSEQDLQSYIEDLEKPRNLQKLGRALAIICFITGC